jgi:DNA-binding Lrp family transcriptional regulator
MCPVSETKADASSFTTAAPTAIVNALHINPRADWSRVAEVLGLSAPTVARRWKALAGQGLAWITPAPGPRYLGAGWSAFIHISSQPSKHRELIGRLCAEPAFATVSVVSGPHDLFVDCFASSNEALMGIVAEAFAELPGVIRREVVFVTKLYRQASEWRSGTLETAQGRLGDCVQTVAGRLHPRSARRRAAAGAGPGRSGELGGPRRACSVSPQTARRRVERFLAAGYMVLRCDAAAAVQQGQREVSLILNVPASRVDAVGRYFAGLPGCRVSAQVLGVQNLLVTLWVRDYLEVQAHERELAALAPGSVVVSRQAVVRTYKRLGHLLDVAGRSTGVVPLPLWSEG